ncbi:Txe/YoeB family addiction module toxin [Deferribacterales bacterium RsTz2092]|nr:addiction module protein [Deferribacterales bacterium]GHU84932.1 addiction module protein [Deferribacterales bacterium]
MYKLVLTQQAAKDATKSEQAGLKPKVVSLLHILKENPFQNPPPYEKLKGLDSTYSRRINRQHRLVYQLLPSDGGTSFKGVIKIIRMWTHYE